MPSFVYKKFTNVFINNFILQLVLMFAIKIAAMISDGDCKHVV